jgi:hypothetical protein
LTATVPNIYAVPPQPVKLGAGGRFLAAGVGLGCLAVLILAASLTPSPTGMSTHAQCLGLPDCTFLQNTKLPCPSCGMTTSFAWFARGNLVASAYVQPMGMILAVMTAAAAWGGLYIAITGRPVHRLLRLLPSRYTLIPLLLVGVLAWGWKIFIHLNGIDGWPH